MKISKYILGAALFAGLFFPQAEAEAQDVKLKCMEWNIKSLEYRGNSNVSKDISRFVTEIENQQADIVCFNEFETLTGAMYMKEKATEFAKELGMYAGADQRSAGWADILVPTDANPTGVKVRIVCTHLDAFGGDETCYEQAKEVIAQVIEPAVAEGTPVILMGDMNCGPSSTAIAEYEKTGKRLCNNNGTFGGSKLDYFIGFPKDSWSSPDFQVLNSDTFYDLSDHYSISGTAVLNK